MSDQENLDTFLSGNMTDQNDSWEKHSIQEVCEVNPDSVNSEGFQYDDMIYLTISNVGRGYISDTDHHLVSDAPSRAKRWVDEGDTVISTVRPGREQYTYIENPPENLVASTGFVVLRPKNSDKLLPRYLYYATTTPDFVKYMVVNATGSAYPSTNLSEIREGEIPIPPIQIQQQIVEILMPLGEKMSLNTQLMEKCEELAETIFGNGMKNAWDTNENVEFKDICDMSSGGPRKSTDDYIGEEHLWLTPSDVTESGRTVVYQTERRLNDRALQETNVDLMPENTIFLSSRATIGEVVINRTPMAMNQGFIALQPKRHIPPHFLLNLVRSKKAEISALASGSTYPEISQRAFGSIETQLPTQEQMDEYERTVEPLYDQVYSLQSENQSLNKLYDELHPRLISGEVIPRNTCQ
ncbi:restriction endonuclease subunit S [Halorubrum sp. AD140]|uniref:restriction endonuclease subunit S n=1 Tax=Halorubrum sp. AD140 TaxID=3050073 RepID=UPI002ACC8ED7|nr:restriction endonuclease subunit S [Halorubrum sp. AD140]MDZ5810561.1 restriction endonuclease subunit S [Halorubrum sp. AD140]